MSKRANPRLVGAFVLIGIALGVVAVVLFSSGQLFTKKYHFIVFFDGSVGGLRPGAPVKYRGVEIGAVSDVRIAMPGTESGASGAGISNRDSVDVLIEQGLRAQLVLESFVTGRRFVELDFLPGTPVNLVNDPGIRLTVLASSARGQPSGSDD